MADLSRAGREAWKATFWPSHRPLPTVHLSRQTGLFDGSVVVEWPSPECMHHEEPTHVWINPSRMPTAGQASFRPLHGFPPCMSRIHDELRRLTLDTNLDLLEFTTLDGLCNHAANLIDDLEPFYGKTFALVQTFQRSSSYGKAQHPPSSDDAVRPPSFFPSGAQTRSEGERTIWLYSVLAVDFRTRLKDLYIKIDIFRSRHRARRSYVSVVRDAATSLVRWAFLSPVGARVPREYDQPFEGAPEQSRQPAAEHGTDGTTSKEAIVNEEDAVVQPYSPSSDCATLSHLPTMGADAEAS